mmetsp:Transcript_64829/g.186525  ORF Transcript_64829/g.186525 Transcript_64829/m.186525 type:complete len:730 (+) Transcript_64829:79-2268(+)
MAEARLGSKSELLNVLGDVKARVQEKLGIVDFPMPQFIIIGSQSVGKSRLIESLAGEQFNFISGTLGSRRPTILEFRNVESATESKWYVLDQETNQWQNKPTHEVMEVVGQAHNSLGTNVDERPVKVRIESNMCVDMQIVDLPGYRSYASNEEGRILAKKIETLNGRFLYDQRNTVICVEEAGDAANLSSLRRVSEADPDYKRTLLVRNKLDKYYNDLDPNNVNKWLEGFGDLPKELKKFALTLPHWAEGMPAPRPLSQLRDEMSKADLNKFASLGTSRSHLDMVGFNNFARYMEKRTERMFVEAIGPVLAKLRELESAMSERESQLQDELEQSDPTQILATVRACGASFANCLTYVMEGVIRSNIARCTLGDELRKFHTYHQKAVSSRVVDQLPSKDFGSLEDYIDFLEKEMQVPAHNVAINGGAQYSRLMFEVETFLRFSDIQDAVKKKSVLQAFGISMTSVTWADVVVKLLNHDAHLPLQQHLAYVGERVKWFFLQQKEPILHFMRTLKGSPDEKLFSFLYTKHAQMIEDNPTIKKLVFETYDAVVERQLNHFLSLFKSTLQATFSNPWVFLRKHTARLDTDMREQVPLPALEDTKRRIPGEIGMRSGVERDVARLLAEIPMEPHCIDPAVDKVQVLVLKVYSHIRSQVCDQVELFCESFFKLPLLRRLEEDMNRIELSQVDLEGYKSRRARLEKDAAANTYGLNEVRDCLQILASFQVKSMAERA